jgi:hypothetical protein
MSTSSIARPSKIYPNRDFWSENIPSGNHDTFVFKVDFLSQTRILKVVISVLLGAMTIRLPTFRLLLT